MTFLRLKPIHVRGPRHPLRPVLPVTEIEANRPVVNQAKAVSKVVRRASKVARPVKRAKASPLLMLPPLVRRSGRQKAKVKRWPLLLLRSKI